MFPNIFDLATNFYEYDPIFMIMPSPQMWRSLP